MGKNYNTKYYNLDVIISVGYRVKSLRGTQFRQWANKILKEYVLRGYSVNHDCYIAELQIVLISSTRASIDAPKERFLGQITRESVKME